MVEWPRGEAAACKAAYTGSNPVSTSITKDPQRAIGAVVARFLDTEEVTGSNPVSPTIDGQPLTSGNAGRGLFLCQPMKANCDLFRALSDQLSDYVGRADSARPCAGVLRRPSTCSVV